MSLLTDLQKSLARDIDNIRSGAGRLQPSVSFFQSLVYKPVILVDADKIMEGGEGFWSSPNTRAMSLMLKGIATQSLTRSPYVQQHSSAEMRGLVDIVSSIVLKKMIKETTPGSYSFNINPATADIAHRKLQTVTPYGFGVYDVEQYGNDLTDIKLEGSTGLMMPPFPLPDLGITMPRLSVPYAKLHEFETFYKNTNKRLFLILFLDAYLCHLNDFSYKFDAYDPRQVNYNFSLSANPYMRFNIITGDIQEVYNNSKMIWSDTVDYKDTMDYYSNDSTKKFVAEALFPMA